jgi:hypothetical protein
MHFPFAQNAPSSTSPLQSLSFPSQTSLGMSPHFPQALVTPDDAQIVHPPGTHSWVPFPHSWVQDRAFPSAAEQAPHPVGPQSSRPCPHVPWQGRVVPGAVEQGFQPVGPQVETPGPHDP